MKLRVISYLIFFLSTAVLPLTIAAQSFDRSAYYKTIESGTTETLDAQLISIRTLAAIERDAYEGALLMKKAGLAGKAKEKLSLFKAGRTKLESAIMRDNKNLEYRFLRVIIQEHAPKIVKYRNNLDEDANMIQSNFKNAPPFLQQHIIDYSKSSKVLKAP